MYKMKAVVFDLAGTLLPSPAKRALINTARAFGISIEMNELKYITVEEIENEVQKHEIKRKNFFERFWKVYLSESKKETLFPETRNVLKKLKEKEIQLALFSDVRKNVVHEILRDHDLEHFFEVIITIDDVQKPKPDPEGLIQILQRLSIEKADIIFVGDRIADKTAGERAGVEFLLIDQSSDLLKLLDR